MELLDPAVAYNSIHLQDLKDRIVASLDVINDADKLMSCLELLTPKKMPGVYTDDEFAEELRLSETGGDAPKKAVDAFFKKWRL